MKFGFWVITLFPSKVLGEPLKKRFDSESESVIKAFVQIGNKLLGGLFSFRRCKPETFKPDVASKQHTLFVRLPE